MLDTESSPLLFTHYDTKYQFKVSIYIKNYSVSKWYQFISIKTWPTCCITGKLHFGFPKWIRNLVNYSGNL